MDIVTLALAKKAISALVPRWTPEMVPQQGSLVLYSGKMYEANTTPTTGTWVASQWTEKDLDDVIGNLSSKVNSLLSVGRFLSTWDCTTGLPVSNPPANPYSYQRGDYYRISVVAGEGGSNYIPNGTSYTGVASTTVATSTVEVRGIYVYDGVGNWLYLPNEYVDQITDVQVDGTSIVNSQGIANISFADYKKAIRKTTLDATATVNTEYYLGSQSNVAIVLPSTASVGDFVSVVFYSGATATTLSITGTTLGEVVTPSTNQRIEINMLYDGTYWAILTNTMATA